MDEEILEFFTRGGVSLPDDMILYISKHFLKPQESLYLALSRVSDRFNFLYGFNRKILDISRCYHVSLDPWQKFFQHHNFASSLTVFNASSCYWLPASALCHSITLMTSLVELIVQDTEIGLIHFPKIFESCQKLLKLSFSLLENNLDQYKEGVMEKEAHDWLTKGFGNLTHLKVFALPSNMEHCMEVWLVIFGVLKWCQNCIHLVIDIPFVPSAYEHHLIAIRNDEKKLLPHLKWFRSLKSVAIFRHDHRFVSIDDNYATAKKFLTKIFGKKNCSPGESMERFWIELSPTEELSERLMTFSSTVKSLLLSHPNNADMLHDDRFRHLQHLGGVDILPFDQLPCLKYIQGRVRNEQAFNEFCELHPLLEHLHVAIDDDDFPDDEEIPFLFDGSWQLLSLKVLVFYGDYWPSDEGEFEARIFEACPNIQELHLGVSLDTDESINFFSKLHLEHLTTLTLESVSLPCGEVLGEKIEKQCPKLKRLQLSGSYDEDHDASFGSGKHLPFITNLRDLRLHWDEISPEQFPMLLDDITWNSPLLERLVVHIGRNSSYTYDENSLPIKLEKTIKNAVVKMKHLILLCLVGFPLSSNVVRKVNERLTRDVLPLRPALKFYLGETFPDATDPTVPRTHCNEMIYPQNQFYAPPPICSSFSI